MASSRNSASPEAFLEQVAGALRRALPAGSTVPRVVVGLSGGRDSVALLFALKELQPDFAYELGACHVNHGISVNAADWQAFCQRLCDDLGILLVTASVSVPQSAPEGVEAAARRCRFEVFATLDADWLMLAQHRGDQAETLLFNLLRGSGVRGACSMPDTREVRPGLRLLRPLLGVSRGDIQKYLHGRSLAWVEDESNADVRFSRNFLRHRIMPELLARFPAAEERFAASAEHFVEAALLLDDLARIDLGEARAGFPIAVELLAPLSEPRARNLLRFLLRREGVGIPGEARLREALRQLLDAGMDRHPSVVFGGWRVFRQRGEVCLEKILGDDRRY